MNDVELVKPALAIQSSMAQLRTALVAVELAWSEASQEEIDRMLVDAMAKHGAWLPDVYERCLQESAHLLEQLFDMTSTLRRRCHVSQRADDRVN